eukprot:6942657-Pyramimonas_sp.AAC.1
MRIICVDFALATADATGHHGTPRDIAGHREPPPEGRTDGGYLYDHPAGDKEDPSNGQQL